MKSAEERIKELSWCLISKGKPCEHCQGCIISDDVKEVHLEIIKDAKEELLNTWDDECCCVKDAIGLHKCIGCGLKDSFNEILGKFEDKPPTKVRSKGL